MTFALTILEAPASKAANKIISPTSTVPYDNVTYWKAYPRELLTLEAMAGALEWLADRPRMMIVRGGLLPPVPQNMWVRRTYADPDYNHFQAVDQAWIPFDFDGTPVSDGLTDGGAVEACGLYLRSLLPPEFRDVRAIASATGSTGRDPTGARLRLFFMLDRTISDEDLMLWTKGVNWTWKLNLDPVVLGTVQPVYTARPTFIHGAVDPVPKDRRVVLLPGAKDRVAIDLDFYVSAATHQQVKERRAVKKGGDDWRSIIDHELGGVDGYHAVIWRALGRGIWEGESDDTMVGYIVAAVAAHGDPVHVRRCDRRYMLQSLKQFRRRDAVNS